MCTLLQSWEKSVHGKVTASGFIEASMSKIQTFQGLLKVSPTVFKDLKLIKNTDLSVKYLLQKC